MLGAATVLGLLLLDHAECRTPGGESPPPPEPACFPPEAGLDELRMQWFCGQLAAAREGRFEAGTGIRFTWIPSCDPTRVVTIRLEGDTIVASGKVLDGAGGYAPRQLARSTRRGVKLEEWRLLLQRFENAGLWDEEEGGDRRGLDGAEWVVEAQMKGIYVFRAVWSPDEESFPQYRKACEYMLSLADVHPGPDAVY